MTLPLASTVANFCRQHDLLIPNDKIIVGVSGGPDSLCLLHLLKTLVAEFNLTLIVAHLNHQLRAEDAQADEDFVRNIAAAWNLPLVVETHPVAQLAAKRKQSLEEAARQVRYAFLWRTAHQAYATKIAVGHHADDQVETVLMHFLRGSGLSGLRGMLPRTDIAQMRLHPADLSAPRLLTPTPSIIRPLLATSRTEIEAYCQTHHLSPRVDASNQDTTFFRNRLRHELIPLLENYNPNIRQTLQRTANVIAADVEFLNQHVEQAWRYTIKNIATDSSGTTTTVEFDLSDWLRLSTAMKRATLRQAVQTLRHGLRDINFEHIDSAVAIVEKAATGSKATLPQGLTLTVGYNSFVVTGRHDLAYPEQHDVPRLDQEKIVPLEFPGTIALPASRWQLKTELLSGGQLDNDLIPQADPWEAYLDAGVIGSQPVLRARQPGDSFCPLGLEGHHKKINEFMINEKIPAEQRNHIPLLVADNQILWVCGYRPDERARVRKTTEQILHLKFIQTE